MLVDYTMHMHLIIHNRYVFSLNLSFGWRHFLDVSVCQLQIGGSYHQQAKSLWSCNK